MPHSIRRDLPGTGDTAGSTSRDTRCSPACRRDPCRCIDPLMQQISVVIVGWQVRDLLRACLGSIAAHEDPGALDIWVVDNASTDGTAAMVAAEFPWVRLVPLPENPGFAAGNNIALRQATGDVCI